MAETWRTHDRLGREVVLTLEGLDHILNEHDDLASQLDEVRRVIEHPDFVTRDVKHPHREIHYRQTPPRKRYIKVVVHYRPIPPQGTWAGEVITAYRVKRPKSKEERLTP